MLTFLLKGGLILPKGENTIMQQAMMAAYICLVLMVFTGN
jgi:hypothetical protein